MKNFALIMILFASAQSLATYEVDKIVTDCNGWELIERSEDNKSNYEIVSSDGKVYVPAESKDSENNYYTVMLADGTNFTIAVSVEIDFGSNKMVPFYYSFTWVNSRDDFLNPTRCTRVD